MEPNLARESTAATVMVCGRHRLTRELLAGALARLSCVGHVVEVASAEEASARYRVDNPDLIVWERVSHATDELVAVRHLLSRHPQARVVLLGDSRDADDLALAVSSGAKGYLVKECSMEELGDAVTAAIAGVDLIGTSMRRAMADRAESLSRASLSQRELQVLHGMALGQSNAEIGRSLFLSEDTVKSHARRLFTKLNVHDRAQAVASGFRLGLVS